MTPPSGRSCVTPASPVFFFFIRAISNNFDIILTSGQKKKAFIVFSSLALFGVI